MSAELDAAKKDYKEKRALAEQAQRTAYDAMMVVEQIIIDEDQKRREEKEKEKITC